MPDLVIREGAFSNNPNLTMVDMGNLTGDLEMEDNVFENTGSTLAVTVNENLLINGNTAFRNDPNNTLFPSTANFPLTCFLEGTLILTPSGYKPIESLKKGDLVRTLKGDKPIDTLLYRKLYHNASESPNRNQLFSLNYPSVFQPLIVTGGHSTLVTPTPEEFEAIHSIFGVPVPVDGFYRLPAYVDKKASIYEVSGDYKIYHIVIGSTFEGIFANGLLVESCVIC